MNRLSSYPHYSSVLNYEGIHFPIALKDVSKFEKLNNLSINVYGIEKSKKNCEIVPLYFSVNKFDKSRIHLLMIELDTGMQVDNVENYQPIYHFAWIRNLSRSLSAQVTNYDKRTWIFDNCLNHFKLQTSFENHKSDCLTVNEVKMILPNKKNKMLSFKNYRYKEAVPFAVYADFECLIEPTGDESRVQKHIPQCCVLPKMCL